MEVQIFTTDTCTACAAAKEFFRAKGLAFRERNVQHDEIALREMIAKSNSYAVPVIEINGEIIIGFDRRRIVELIEA
jgi:glutaredoxin